jgi:predicted acetyltransferase
LSDIKVIKREKKKSKSLWEEQKKKENSQNYNYEELEQMITKLKFQAKEDRRIQETLREKLEERCKTIERLEAKVVTLKKYLHKKDMQQKNTKILDNIINSQINYYDRSSLGKYQMQTEEGSSSKMTEKEVDPRSC